MTVLNQVRPSSLSCKKSFSTRAICLGLGAADIVAAGLCGEFCSDASLPDWLEGGGGALANTSSQKLGAWAARSQERQEHHGSQLVARVGQRYHYGPV